MPKGLVRAIAFSPVRLSNEFWLRILEGKYLPGTAKR